MMKSEVRNKKYEIRSQKQERILPLASCLTPLFLLLAVFTGCASPKGRLTLMPMPNTAPGYNNSGQGIVFANRDVKISIRLLNPEEAKRALKSKDANNPLAETLATSQYLEFLLDIENLSKAKVMYNPSFTTLFDNNMGVRKPLDYTDMYALVQDLSYGESSLKKIKDMFYDIAVTLEPGQQTSRLLVFPGSIDEEASQAAIIMKEIYIGTSAITVSFEFKVVEGIN